MKYTIKTISLFIVAIVFASHLSPMQAQNSVIWRDISERSLPDNGGERAVMPQSYRLVEADMTALDDLLGQAPLENSREARTKSVELTLPLPDGTFGLFRVENSPIMEAPLAAKYPHMTTYQAWGITDKTASARLDRLPDGFHAMILSVNDTIFIDPYRKNDTTRYISYYRRDDVKAGRTFKETLLEKSAPISAPRQQAKIGDVLHTYRLAVAAAGEYTEQFGGVQGALAAIIKTVNRVNTIYQRDISTRFILIGNEEKIIFTNKATDPYADVDAPGKDVLAENQQALDSIIGTANYDMGHIFDISGGGVAGTGPCLADSKAMGQSGSDGTQGDTFDVDLVAHEMGHQLGASHTFNAKSAEAESCSSDNFMTEGAYEPGSASTIMSYAGVCGSQNLQNNSDDYFHAISIQEMTDYINSADGKSCGTHTPTGNNPPVVTVEADKTIGFKTPFTLNGSATDADGDTLTYAWEQFDPGTGWTAATVLPNTDIGQGPIFRSYKPVTTGSRTFPNPNFPGLAAKGESLPTSARVLHFRLTVRDGRGGVFHADMKVNVTAGGPQATPTTPGSTPTATATLSPNVTPTATAQPGSLKVFLPIIIKTTGSTGTTPTPNSENNRVINGSFDNGEMGWDDEGNNAEVPGGCAAGQADIESYGIFQCIVINPHTTNWTFGATANLRQGNTDSALGIALDFYPDTSCNSNRVLFTQEIYTSETTAANLSQSFRFDSQAQNAASVGLSLFTLDSPDGGTPPHGCFDEVFVK